VTLLARLGVRREITALRNFARLLTRNGCARTLARRAIAHPRAAHADRTDAGHDLALWQMAVAHQPLAAIIGRLVGVPTEQAASLRAFVDLAQEIVFRNRAKAPS
jgi:hypothetical protein